VSATDVVIGPRLRPGPPPDRASASLIPDVRLVPLAELVAGRVLPSVRPVADVALGTFNSAI